MLNEQTLKQFVEYYNGNLECLNKKCAHPMSKRASTAVVFYILHHPEIYSDLSDFWHKCVNQQLEFIRRTKYEVRLNINNYYRTDEIKDYFFELYGIWEKYLSKKGIFRCRYQNFSFILTETLPDMLYTLTFKEFGQTA